MKKFIFSIIVITITVVLPYFFHNEIYRACFRQYYFYKYSGNEYMVEARELYDAGKYRELKKFIDPLLTVYTEDNELKRLAGINLIHLGEEIKGAEIYTSGMDNVHFIDIEVSKVIRILYYKKHFSDVVCYYDSNILRNNADISFYYGVSLFNRKRYDDALNMLKIAEKKGYAERQQLFYYLGLICELRNNNREAAEYLSRAYNERSGNDEVIKALVRVYGKNKMYEEAEAFIRKSEN